MYSKQPVPEDIPMEPNALLRIGVVASVDLESARCVVEIGDPDNGAIETPEIRWTASRIGNTRIWCPPVEGEQVLVAFPAGELAAGLIIASIACNAFPPAGDSLIENVVFSDGAVISYDAESHVLSAILPAGSQVQIQADTVAIEGDLEVSGTIAALGEITSDDDVKAASISLKTHKHGQVQAGSAQSGVPV